MGSSGEPTDARYEICRQHQILNYIVDFVCIEKRLVIEVDDKRHAEEDVSRADDKRTTDLRKLGYTVIRFWNIEVFSDVEAVMTMTYNWLDGIYIPES